MFQRKRHGGLKQAIDRATDPELQDLRAQVAERQERVAQLELELSETRIHLDRFEGELESRLGDLQRQLSELKKQLEDARRRAAHRAQWGGRSESPELADDVVEQFRKTWSRGEKPPSTSAPQHEDSEMSEALKALFRKLAKRYHPDLAQDPEEKRRRARKMAKINQAYAARDLETLRQMAEEPIQPEVAVQKTRQELVKERYTEIRRLDGVIRELEFTLQRLTNSHTVRLMLDMTIARRAGRDLLAEMANDLRVEIARIEVELAALS